MKTIWRSYCIEQYAKVLLKIISYFTVWESFTIFPTMHSLSNFSVIHVPPPFSNNWENPEYQSVVYIYTIINRCIVFYIMNAGELILHQWKTFKRNVAAKRRYSASKSSIMFWTVVPSALRSFCSAASEY